MPTTLANIPSFAAHLDDDTIQMLMGVETLKRHDDRVYNQRTASVTLAHVRHCIAQARKHNNVYGDIVSIGDLARKSPEMKIETRLAIYAMGEVFRSRHYSERGVAMEIVRYANGGSASEETPSDGG
jgi:hypothetical protein